MPPLLEIEDLSIFFHTEENIVKSVRNLDLTIHKGETLALVGESGCGKSVTALSAMRLIPTPPGKFESGRILFEGQDLLHASEVEMQNIRGNEISMIFQEPMTSLNPIFTVGDQIIEAIRLHQNKTASQARELALNVLHQVTIPSPEIRIDQYPHELSGGMKQRVMIAMAIVCQPALLIADEPTTALDVTIQAQILDLLDLLRKETQMSILLITHDLGVVAEIAKRVMVMYAGEIVETGPVRDLFRSPLHPYTIGLMKSIPALKSTKKINSKLNEIPGAVPSLSQIPSGCPFHPRCPSVENRCKTEKPKLKQIADDYFVSCWLHE